MKCQNCGKQWTQGQLRDNSHVCGPRQTVIPGSKQRPTFTIHIEDESTVITNSRTRAFDTSDYWSERGKRVVIFENGIEISRFEPFR